MSDRINQGMSLVVSVAILLALCAMANVPNNPARHIFEIIRQIF